MALPFVPEARCLVTIQPRSRAGVLLWRRFMDSRKVLMQSLAVATALAAFSSLRMVDGPVNGAPVYGPREVILGTIYPYAWALEVPLLALFFARYPLAGQTWRRVLTYCAVGALASLGPVLANRAAWSAAVAHPVSRSIILEVLSGVLIFWIIAGVFETVIARQQVRDLQGQRARAELQNLKSQLHPHFLFNTLHTISVLTRQDAEAAHRIARRATRVRRSLRRQSAA